MNLRDGVITPVHLFVNSENGNSVSVPATPEELNLMDQNRSSALSALSALEQAESSFRAAVEAHADPVVRELGKRLLGLQ